MKKVLPQNIGLPVRKILFSELDAEAFLYDMVLSGDAMYRKSLEAAVRGQEKTRAKMAEKLPVGSWALTLKSKREEMTESQWDKLLRIKTSGRDDSHSDKYHYPYEPTPYSVLERL